MLVEWLWVGGMGILVFYILVGVGIQVVDGGLLWCYDVLGGVVVVLLVKEIWEFDGVIYVFEWGIWIDFVLVYVWQGDWYGNLMYCYVVVNFNLECVFVGRIMIVEVEYLVELGEIDFVIVYILGVFVYWVVYVFNFVKKIEREMVW